MFNGIVIKTQKGDLIMSPKAICKSNVSDNKVDIIATIEGNRTFILGTYGEKEVDKILKRIFTQLENHGNGRTCITDILGHKESTHYFNIIEMP